MRQLSIVLLLFGVAFAAALTAGVLLWAAEMIRARRTEAPETGEPDEGDQASGLIKDEGLSTIALWARLLRKVSHAETLRRQIGEADLDWTVGRLTMMMLFCGTLAAAWLWSIEWMPEIVTLLVSTGSALSPYVYIQYLRTRRLSQFSAQLPDALESLSRALKAGFPLAVAMETVTMEQAEPLASELRRVRDEWRLGIGWEQALQGLMERVPVAEVHLFAAAVRMQSRMGGKLNEVLGQLAESMRESAALEGEVRAVSAHSRITGTVLSVLPAVLAVVLFLVNPEPMREFAASREGRIAITMVVIANLAAHFIISRMSKIET